MFTENLPGFFFIVGCIVGLVALTIIGEVRSTNKSIKRAEAELDTHLATVTTLDPAARARARSMQNHPAGRGL